MYIVQKRDSKNSSWKTCSYNGRKCRYTILTQAWAAIRKQKEALTDPRYPDREFRIIDGETNTEVK